MKRIFLISFIIVFSLVGTSCSRRVKLPKGFAWKDISPNETAIFKPDGKMLIGPGYITAWGKYPFIYGCDGKKYFFFLNLENSSIIFFDDNKKFDDYLAKNDLPFFHSSRSDRHQISLYDIIYGKTSHADEFLQNIGAPK